MMSDWISVEEKLPEDGQVVLTYTGVGNPIILKFSKPSTWEWLGIDFSGVIKPEAVTHWMPLPEPPKEEKP